MQSIISFFHTQPALFIIGILIILLLLAMATFLPFLVNILLKKAEQIKSEKVSLRVKDAIKKVSVVIATLVDAEGVVFKKNYLEAIKDGRIDDAEITKMVADVSAKALEILKPELDTLRKFFVGDMVLEWLTLTVKSYLVGVVQEKLAMQIPLIKSPSETK